MTPGPWAVLLAETTIGEAGSRGMLADYWAGLLAETIVTIQSWRVPCRDSGYHDWPGAAQPGSDTVTIGSAGESKPGPAFKLAETIGLFPGWTIGRDY